MGKDVEWKAFFEDNRRYADIINGIGCGGMQVVKDTDLTEADSTSKKKSRDLLRKAALGMNFMIVGIENQGEMDYELPLRNMHYDVTNYQKQVAKIRKEIRENTKGLEPGEYLYGFKKDSKLNPVVTFVLYSGRKKWSGADRLHDMLDFTDIPYSLKSLVSDYKINLIDIRNFENTDVFQTDVKQVFDFIRCSEDEKKLVELVESDVYYTQMDEEAFDVVTKYTNLKELIKAKEYLCEGGKTNVCKAIRDLMEHSREEGLEQGIEQGIEQGREQGIEQGVLAAKKTLVINMLKENEPIDRICRMVECDKTFVEQVRGTM